MAAEAGHGLEQVGASYATAVDIVLTKTRLAVLAESQGQFGGIGSILCAGGGGLSSGVEGWMLGGTVEADRAKAGSEGSPGDTSVELEHDGVKRG